MGQLFKDLAEDPSSSPQRGKHLCNRRQAFPWPGRLAASNNCPTAVRTAAPPTFPVSWAGAASLGLGLGLGLRLS